MDRIKASLLVRPLILITLILSIAFPAIANDKVNIEAKYASSSKWWNGLKLTITNIGSESIDGWELEFDFPFSVGWFSGAAIKSHNGTHYVLKPNSWGGGNYLTPGESVSISGGCSLNGNSPSDDNLPSSFIFNGIEFGGESENNPPKAMDDSSTVTAGKSVTVSVLTNDSDPDGDTIIISSIKTLPSKGEVVISNDGGRHLLYTADADASGQDSFEYSISDGNGGEDTATVSITINDKPNTPPTVTITYPSNGSVIEQEELSEVQITINPEDNDGTIVSSEISVDGKTFNGNRAGWVPSAFGTYEIIARVKDNDNAEATARSTIEIKKKTAVNIPPTVSFTSHYNNDIIKLEELSPITLKVEAEDSDGTIAKVKIEVDNQVFEGSTASWTPSGFGKHTVTVTAEDNKGLIATAILTLTVSKKISEPAKKQIIGYLPQWDGWKNSANHGLPGQGSLNHLNIDWDKYTIVNFAFFGVANDGSLHNGEDRNKQIHQHGSVQQPAPLIKDSDWAFDKYFFHDTAGNPTMFDMAKEHGVKLMASIGGWSMCKHFPEMAADPVKRARFIDECKVLIEMGFDGIDLDWEYPAHEGMNIENYSDADYHNFTVLAKEIREAIGPDKMLTSCFSCDIKKLEGFRPHWADITESLDFLNFMTFDIDGGWSDNTGHNSPLYQWKDPENKDNNFSWDKTFKYLTQDVSLDPAKINMGMAFYGRGVVTKEEADLGVETYKTKKEFYVEGFLDMAHDFDKFGDKNGWEGTPYYYYILQTTSDWTEHWDNIAKVPFKTKGKSFLSYDNERSIEEKSKYIVQNEAAGVIIWNANGDAVISADSKTATYSGEEGTSITSYSDIKNPLLDTVHRIFTNYVYDPNNKSPELDILEPADGHVFVMENLEPVTISITAGDSDGSIEYTEVKVGDKTFSERNISWTPNKYGKFSITAFAADDKGESCTKQINITILDPNIPPKVSFVYPSNNEIFVMDTFKPIEIEVKASDIDGIVESTSISVDERIISSNTTASWIPTKYGKYTITAEVIDDKGKSTIDSISIEIKKRNNTPLEWNISYSAWSNGYGVSVDIKNNTAGEVKSWKGSFILPKGHDITGNWDFDIVSETEVAQGTLVEMQSKSWESIPSGDKRTIGMNVSKPAGTTAELIDFYVEIVGTFINQFPVVRFSYPSDGDTIAMNSLEPVNIRASIYDPDGTVVSNHLIVDGQTYDNTTELSWTPEDYGIYTISANATDNTGAFTEKNINITINKDSSHGGSPVIEFLNPKDNQAIHMENLQPVIVEVDVEDDDLSSVSITVDGQTYEGAKIVWNPTAFGTYQIEAKAEDLAGNISMSYITITLNAGQIEGMVKGWPNYISMGAVTQGIKSHHTNRPVDAVFKYAGDGGNGDRGSIKYPIYTKNTAAMSKELEIEYNRHVIPVMVVYTAEMSGGTNFADLHNYDNLVKHFINLIHTCQILQSFKSESNMYPGSIVLNPDLFGMVQQMKLLADIASEPIEVQKALAQAIHCVEDKVDYNGMMLNPLEIFEQMRNQDGIYSDWDVKINWENLVQNEIFPASSDGPINGIPSFNDDFKGWIQATNFVIGYFAPDVTFGWQENLWSRGSSGWTGASEEEVRDIIAPSTINLWSELEIYSGQYKPDFIVFDKYERDAASGGWLYDDHQWDSVLNYAKYISIGLGDIPVMLWQIPGGHLQTINDIDQRDSHASTAPNYFFGDSELMPDLSNLKSYISGWKNTLLENGFKWSEDNGKLQKAKESNVFSILWGGGDTTSVGRFPTDDNGWLSERINEYYQNPVYLDGSGSGTIENRSPIANPDSISLYAGETLIVDVLVNDNDPDSDTISLVSVGEAAQGTAVISGDKISYSADFNASESDTFTYTISDGQGHEVSGTVNVEIISDLNNPPKAIDDSSTVTSGESVTVNVLDNDSDPDEDTIVISSVGQGSKGTTVISGNSIVYTANSGTLGSDSFTYTINDGNDSEDIATVFVTINEKFNVPPSVEITSPSNGAVIMQENLSAVTVKITAEDSDGTVASSEIKVDGQTFSAETASWTPSTFGTFTIIAKVTDNEGVTAEDSITITVKEKSIQQNIVIKADYANSSAWWNGLDIEIANNSTEAIDGWELEFDFPFSIGYFNGAVIKSKVGSHYTLVPNSWGSGKFISSGSTVKINGGFSMGGSSPDQNKLPQTFIFNGKLYGGESENKFPVADNDTAETTAGEVVIINTLANDTDPDGDELKITSVSGFSLGTAVISGNAIEYTPNTNAEGTDTFSYTVSDGNEGVDSAEVFVTIKKKEIVLPVINIILPTDGTVIEQKSLSVIDITVAASDSDGTVESVTILVDGQSFTGKTASWMPSAFGTYTINATAVDNDGNASNTSISIAVKEEFGSGSNIPPTVSFTSHSDGEVIELGELSPITFTVQASDEDGTIASSTIYIGNEVYSDTTASWTPVAFGAYEITTTVEDDKGATATVLITVTVNKKVSTQKQIIGYMNQWDCWKENYNFDNLPQKGALNHLNVDMSKYSIINFSFFGVAKDGSLHSGDLRPREMIWDDSVVHEPAALIDNDKSGSYDTYFFFGDEKIKLWYVNNSDEEYLKELGIEWDRNSWYNPNTGEGGAYPILIPKKDALANMFESAKKHGTKIMASIGGWTMCKHFAQTAADPEKRERFIEDCKKIINMGFDGIDLDWEYPGHRGMNILDFSDADYANFTLFVKEIREAIGPDKLLTSCFSCDVKKLEKFDWLEINKNLDYFNIMSFDMYGGWSDNTGHNSQLYGRADEHSWDRTFKYLTETVGLNTDKINMGMAFYGRSVVTDGSASLGAPTVKTLQNFYVDGPLEMAHDFINFNKWEGTPYYDYLKKHTTDWTEHWDDVAKVPYKTKNNYFISYDNEQSIGDKAQYVMDHNAAGVIIWNAYGDIDFSNALKVNENEKIQKYSNLSTPLLDIIYNAFNETGDNAPPTVTITSPADGTVIKQETLSAISIEVEANDPDGGNVAVTIEVDGLVFNGQTASWTPSVFGTFKINATVVDDEGNTVNTSITVTVKDSLTVISDEQEMEVNYTIDGYGNSYSINMNVTNPAEYKATSWEGTFIIPEGQSVNNMWGGVLVSQETVDQGILVTVANPSWSEGLEPDGSTTLGITINCSGSNCSPELTDLLFIGILKTPPIEGTGFPEYVFAPYVDICAWPTPSMQDYYDKTGQKYVTLAFVVAKPNGTTPTWGGFHDITETEHFYSEHINVIRKAGGDVIVSFGGETGTTLATAITDEDELFSTYKLVIDTYKLTWVDFDIEGAAVADVVSNQRRNRAIKRLQDEYPELKISYCLPVLPTGLTGSGLAIVQHAADIGINVYTVNAMSMCFGGQSVAPREFPMSKHIIDSIVSVKNQIAPLYPNKTEDELWKLIGVTPMTGYNYGEPPLILWQEDARQLKDFAQQVNMRALSMWSMTRDHDGSANEGQVTANHNGIPQEEYEFTNIFKSFSSNE